MDDKPQQVTHIPWEALPEGQLISGSPVVFTYKVAQAAATKPSLRDADDTATICLKCGWSAVIAVMLIALLSFQYRYMYLIGKGQLDFTDYNWLAEIVMGSNFVAIVGLAHIILQYLYSKESRPKRKRDNTKSDAT